MRSKILAIGLVLGTLVAAPAFADDAKGPKLNFPVPAATFKQHVDARLAKARQHMEQRASTLPADQAKELRAKFEQNLATVNAEVAKAIADGTVTADEAKAVRAASPHRGGGGCDHKGGKSTKA
jgi:hypothetical protein